MAILTVHVKSNVRGLLEEYPSLLLFFFCKHLMVMKQPRLHQPTLNLRAHVPIFSSLLITSVAGTQRLSEIVCSALVGFFIAREMTERLEQYYCIKFHQKLGDSQVETIWKIQVAFGDDTMSSTQIKVWYNRFKDGRTSVESEPGSGRPSTCQNDQVIAEVNAVVMRDLRVTIREIAEEVGISTFSAHSIMTEDLAMKRVAAKFVPKLLTVEQKQLCVEVSQDMLDSTNSDPDFMNTIITGDESWVYRYDPETKSQSSKWKHSPSPRPKKARQVRSNVKVMLTAFFDSRGVVHHEYAPQGQTITKEYYSDVLRRLRDAVRRKRPELWSTGNWHIHYDNAPAHSSHLIQTFLA
ncbi:protein GVQW3-like [Dermacentor silvarum]|uniref:protein GVQW3-like n=1 Tax=Dermacentor silvarum TaxID=543639 RepID=UPI0021012866|nr:protein GVQW3-like [Dermacentor silvarum]